MGDENHSMNLGDYSKPNPEGYMKTLEPSEGTSGTSTIRPITVILSTPVRTVSTTATKDIMMFQQHHGESLSEAWTHFKDLLRKVPYYGLDLWLQVQIFYDHVDYTT
ncbi:hypothetical protein Tco_1506035 [Tanacetum coccineum]